MMDGKSLHLILGVFAALGFCLFVVPWLGEKLKQREVRRRNRPDQDKPPRRSLRHRH